jgi:hypothetical protein
MVLRRLYGCRSVYWRAARGSVGSKIHDRSSQYKLGHLDAAGHEHNGQFRLVLLPGRGIALLADALLRDETETVADFRRERMKQGPGSVPALLFWIYSEGGKGDGVVGS